MIIANNPIRALAGALLALAATAQAAIAPGSSGDGELFLNVYDAGAEISYTLDLGVRMDQFFAQAQADAGWQRFWTVDDSIWTAFLAQARAAELRWSVNALDTAGSTSTPGLQRLFTTVRQGDEAAARDMQNQKLTDGMGAAQAGTFFSAVNAFSLVQRGQSTHGVDATPNYDLHGSSWSLRTDPGNAYYGKAGGLGATLNGNASFNLGNAVGESSWFYYLTRSGASPGGKVLVDEFDNLGHDGYFGFTYVDPSLATSPYAGKYLLSYTIEAAGPTAAQRTFVATIGRSELNGGYASRVLGDEPAGVAGAAGRLLPGERAAAGVALIPPVVGAVPEPGTWVLLGIGLLAVARQARRGG